ncbi:hypothetical protein OSTOST_05331 [Ostertagia ostertagi]
MSEYLVQYWFLINRAAANLSMQTRNPKFLPLPSEDRGLVGVIKSTTVSKCSLRSELTLASCFNVEGVLAAVYIAERTLKGLNCIKVDYSFETESVLYDVVENKPKAPTTYVAGNFSFESLHHDLEGGMLGRYRLTVCKTGNCGNVRTSMCHSSREETIFKKFFTMPRNFLTRSPGGILSLL